MGAIGSIVSIGAIGSIDTIDSIDSIVAIGAIEAVYAANELGMREMQAKVFEARSMKSPDDMDIMIAMPDAEQAEVKVV